MRAPAAPASYEFLMAAEVLMRENHLEMPLNVDFYIALKHLFTISKC